MNLIFHAIFNEINPQGGRITKSRERNEALYGLKTVQRSGAGNFNLLNADGNEKEVRNTENRPVIVRMVVGELIIEFFCDEGTELDAI